jgi:hypothetical protein
MATDPFNSVGGYTVGIPPVSIIDSTGNITADTITASNVIVTTDGLFIGNVTAPNFIGNVIGNISGNLIVPGIENEIIYNNGHQAAASPNFTFDPILDVVTIAGNLIANTLTMGSGITEFSTASVLFATTLDASANQVLHKTLASTVSSIDYTVIATDPTSNSRQTSKLIAGVLGDTVDYYEYGTIDINGGVGDFRVIRDAGNVILTVTPMNANQTDYRIMVTQYKDI